MTLHKQFFVEILRNFKKRHLCIVQFKVIICLYSADDFFKVLSVSKQQRQNKIYFVCLNLKYKLL